jgi:hypothetical protein
VVCGFWGLLVCLVLVTWWLSPPLFLFKSKAIVRLNKTGWLAAESISKPVVLLLFGALVLARNWPVKMA